MKLDPARLLAPLLAALLLLIVLQHTVSALRSGGVWGRRRTTTATASPYGRLQMLLRPGPQPADPGRDPFAFGRAPAPAAAPRATVVVPRAALPPPAPARPVLTSIVWAEGSPGATIRWQGRDYPVQVNTLFDEFRVRSITRSQVTLERGAEILVLQLPLKGDSA